LGFGIWNLTQNPFEQRNTPPLFGLGLLESIPQSAIDAVALAQPPAIRGRSPRLADGAFGRFGWKANVATLAGFNEMACAVELGLSTPAFEPRSFRPLAGLPPPSTQAAPKTKLPDMSADDLTALTRFVADLPAPRQVVEPARREQIVAGEAHFHAIGCASCHTPNLGGVTGVYSDLLLHNVGTTGAAYYSGPTVAPPGPSPLLALGSAPVLVDVILSFEFRTPPLWGLADSGPYLHDGSALTRYDAILSHSGQAEKSKEAFAGLNLADRLALQEFLASLHAPQ